MPLRCRPISLTNCKKNITISGIVVDRMIVVLLCSGSKKTQRRDIQKAKEYWEELRSRADE